jgi:hypothetical protein
MGQPYAGGVTPQTVRPASSEAARLADCWSMALAKAA